MSRPPSDKDGHPLANLLINVLVPVLVLGVLSKDPALQKEPRVWHIGPIAAMIVALSLPLGYGLWFVIRRHRINMFSLLGVASVLLTGGLTIYLWNSNGTVKPHAGLLFSIKEAIMPLILGVVIWWSPRGTTPLIRVFLYHDGIFDIGRIEARVAELKAAARYEQILGQATRLFAASFFLSALLNLIFVQWFFRGFDPQAADAFEQFNAIVGKVMGWGMLVIGVPVLAFMMLTLKRLVGALKTLTGLKDVEVLVAR
jgi:hypothetical protein